MNHLLARVLSAVLCTSLPIASAALAPATAQEAAREPQWHRALSLMGNPKYPTGFPHFDYVNPAAPKGGLVRLASQGTFDSFNLVVAGVKGEVEDRIGLIYDTLMASSADEISTEYGLIAEAVRYPDDFSSVTYRLNPEARWHDGTMASPSRHRT